MASFVSGQAFVLSRSKIELSIDCPRCFYLDRKRGVSRVSGPSFTLNSAVDTLLKNECDALRKTKQPHPVCVAANLNLIPFDHPEIPRWRGEVVAYSGIQVKHAKTGWTIDGLVDDVWQTPDGSLVVVDYKSTSKSGPIVFGSSKYHDAYKRQLEIYQWLLAESGFKVDPTAYIVYANGLVGAKHFNKKLEFELTLHPYKGDYSWVFDAIDRAYEILHADTPPAASKTCQWCQYRSKAARMEEPLRLL